VLAPPRLARAAELSPVAAARSMSGGEAGNQSACGSQERSVDVHVQWVDDHVHDQVVGVAHLVQHHLKHRFGVGKFAEHHTHVHMYGGEITVEHTSSERVVAFEFHGHETGVHVHTHRHVEGIWRCLGAVSRRENELGRCFNLDCFRRQLDGLRSAARRSEQTHRQEREEEQ
jgi:hypothetical protein